MREMERAELARGILLVDGVGCAAAALVVLTQRRLVGLVDPTLRARWPLVAALGATSATLLLGARNRRPADRDLARAAAVNAAWVTACLAALRRPATRTGAALIATTAALDGATGAVQWCLRGGADHPASE